MNKSPQKLMDGYIFKLNARINHTFNGLLGKDYTTKLYTAKKDIDQI